MVKKKISGQTVTIIVLIVLLVCAIAFGSVYAFYSTDTTKVSGTISMASLYIDYKYDDITTEEIEGVIKKGQSGKSEILITNKDTIVPNELLGNSPLKVVNSSETPIYLVMLYRVEKAVVDENNHIDDIYVYLKDSKGQHIKDENGNSQLVLDAKGNKQVFGVLDIGTNLEGSIWSDFVFDTNDYPEYAVDNITTNDNYIVRCFVTKAPQTKGEITVIEKNNLRMHKDVGNEFQKQSISFTFQAHAISANSFQFDENTTQQEKNSQIVKWIYRHNGYVFNV